VPADRPGPERSKVLSVRLTTDEFDRLSRQADEIGVGASTLARTFIRQGLSVAPSAKRVRAQADSPLEAQLVADLIARVEALERWVADH
jgi:hypothetical protein